MFLFCSSSLSLSDCPRLDLLDDFLVYGDRQLTSPAVPVLFSGQWPEPECREQCLATPDCRALNVRAANDSCSGLGEAVAEDLGPDAFRLESGTSFLIRKCQ